MGLLGCLGCAPEPRPPAPVVPPPALVTAGAEVVSCLRVGRAKRMWSGFLIDVPSAAMVRALDVVVPIQIALGDLFCPNALSACRPAELLSIDLTDELANEAHVALQLREADSQPALALILRREAEQWRAEPESLADYLAQCRIRMAETRAGDSF